jgi:hypothetical protein
MVDERVEFLGSVGHPESNHAPDVQVEEEASFSEGLVHLHIRAFVWTLSGPWVHR